MVEAKTKKGIKQANGVDNLIVFSRIWLSQSTWVDTRVAVVCQSIYEQENGYKLHSSNDA